MVRGPICAETNPVFVRTPGSTGCNDSADPYDPFLAFPLLPNTAKYRKGKGKRQRKATRRKKRGGVDAVANLKKPSAKTIEKLSQALKKVRELDQKYVKENKEKDDALRLAKEEVVKQIVKEFGVGLKYASRFRFSNKKESDLANTMGDDIEVYDGALGHPGFVASVVLHESSHAQRNSELEKAGVKRRNLGFVAGDIWKELIEIEGYQLEIDHAATTGLTAAEIKGATRGRDDYLRLLEGDAGEKTRKEVESGGLDRVRARYIRQWQQKVKP